MAKHTQAHMTRKMPLKQSKFLRERTLDQMEYYMGAKLLEIGVDPKSAVYRWSRAVEGDREVVTYSAYWGDSKERLDTE